MSKQSKSCRASSIGRVAKWALVALALATLLAACGGGGGGGESTPPPDVSASVTCPNGSSQTATAKDLAAATAAAIAKCPDARTLSVTPGNGESVQVDKFAGVTFVTDSRLDAGTLTPVNVTVTTPANAKLADVTVTIGQDGKSFAVAFKPTPGGVYTLNASVKDLVGHDFKASSSVGILFASCTAPKVQNSTGTACVLPTLTYGEKVFAIWDWAYPYQINKSGMKAKVANKTTHVNGGGGVNPLINCGLGRKLSTGWFEFRCTDTDTHVEVGLLFNPAESTLYNNPDPEVTPGPEFMYVQSSGAHFPTWANEAAVSDGSYFVPGGVTPHQFDVMFHPAVGAAFVAVPGDFVKNGNVNVLFAVSN